MRSILEAEKRELHYKCIGAKRVLDEARAVFNDALNKYEILRRRFEEVDRMLAEIDGRVTKVTRKTKTPEINISSLTRDQLLRIAAELDVELEMEAR